MEGKSKTLEGGRTPFRMCVQRGKAATGRFCVAKSPFPLQTSLTSRELPPSAPAHALQRFVSLCMRRVRLGEVFCRLGRYGFFYRVRLRARLVSGARKETETLRRWRFIPPHQSLTRQLPPKGKPLQNSIHFLQQGGRVEFRKPVWFCNSACFLNFLFTSRNCIHHVRTGV